MIDYQLTEYLEQFVTDKRKNLFKRILEDRTRHFTVAIEDIFQPQNGAAIVRTCDIFGVQDVHIIENKYKFYASNQVAKGAQKWLDFSLYNERNVNNTKVCMDNLRSKGYQIIATTPHNESCYLEDFDVTKKSAFFFGVEKEGLSKEVMDNADGYLKIPMVGFTESLNISVSAAIILQHATSKLKKTDINWQLTEDEKLEKRLDWCKKTIKSYDDIVARFYSDKS